MRLATAVVLISLGLGHAAVADVVLPGPVGGGPDIDLDPGSGTGGSENSIPRTGSKNRLPDLAQMTAWFMRAQRNAVLIEASEQKVAERRHRLDVATEHLAAIQASYSKAMKQPYPSPERGVRAKSAGALQMVRALVQIEMTKLDLWHQAELTRHLKGPAVTPSDARLAAFAEAILAKRRETRSRLDAIFVEHGSKIADANFRPQFLQLVNAVDAEFAP